MVTAEEAQRRFENRFICVRRGGLYSDEPYSFKPDRAAAVQTVKAMKLWSGEGNATREKDELESILTSNAEKARKARLELDQLDASWLARDDVTSKASGQNI